MLIRFPTNKPLKQENNTSKGQLFIPQINTIKSTKKVASKPRKLRIVVYSVAFAMYMKDFFKSYENCYRLVTTEKELINYLEARPELGFDTETDGLDRYKDVIAGFSVGNDKDCIYVPLNHRVGTNYQGDFKRLQEILNANGRKYWGMNTKFDRGVLKIHCGFDIKMKWDAEIAARLIDNRESAKLKEQYVLHIDPTAQFYEFKSLFKQPFTYYDPEVVGIYGGIDSMKHYIIGVYQEKLLREKFPRIYKLMKNVELPLIDVVLDMELYGIAIDKEYYKQFTSDLRAEMDEKLSIIQKDFPNFNPNSPKQVGEVLFDRLRLPDPSRSRKTGEEWLLKIKHPISKLIIEIRKLSKAISTYTEAIPALAIEDENGIPIIHTTYHTIGADCVVGDTLIPTEFGLKTAKELCTGDWGVWKDADFKLINKDKTLECVSGTIKFKDSPIKKVLFERSFELEGTPHHPVLLSSNEFCNLKDLKVGDTVKIPFGFDWEGTLQDICVSHRIDSVTWKGRGKFPTKFNEDFAEFLGIYKADGSSRGGNGSYTIRIANKSNSVKQRVYDLILKLFDLEAKIKEDGVEVSWIGFTQLKKYFEVGARNKKLPIELYSSPKEVVSAYLRGCLLDSSIDERPRLVISFGQKEDVKFFKLYLQSQGILSSWWEVKRESNRTHGNGTSDNMYWYRLRVSSDHYNKFLEVVGDCYGKYSKSFKNHRKVKIEDGFIRVKVIEISDGISDVFDFNLPKTHSFISNGLISHNTGRFSSSEPNLQNQPRDNRFRRGFVARPGCKLVSCDFSQQEQAVLAGASRDPKMLEGSKLGKDFYALMASIIWNLPYEVCTKKGSRKDLRDMCKSLVLGITYGMGAQSLSESLNNNSKDHVYTPDEAQAIMDKFYSGFPQVKQFQEWCHKFAIENGYMEDMLGRRRYFRYLGKPPFECPDNKDVENTLNSLKYYNQIRACLDEMKVNNIKVFDNRWRQGDEMRQTVNHVCQGTAASQTKICMLALYNDDSFNNKYHGKLLLQVHDEIIAEFPDELAEEGGNYMAKIMEDVGSEVIGTKIWCEPQIMKFWTKD